MEKNLYTMTQVGVELGITQATLRKYIKRLEITTRGGGLDWREKFITLGQLAWMKAVIKDKSLLASQE